MCHRSCVFSLSVCDSHFLCLPNNDFFLFFSFLVCYFFFVKKKAQKKKKRRNCFFGSFIIIHKILIDVLLFFFCSFCSVVLLCLCSCTNIPIYNNAFILMMRWEEQRNRTLIHLFILKDFFLLWSNNKCFFCVWYTWENGRLLKYIRMRDTFTSYVFFHLSFSL